MTCWLDAMVQEPPTFAVTAVGVTVILMAPSVVSAVGAAIARAASVPIAVQLGEPTMAVVEAVAPIVAVKAIVQPMAPGPVSLPSNRALNEVRRVDRQVQSIPLDHQLPSCRNAAGRRRDCDPGFGGTLSPRRVDAQTIDDP